MIYESMARNDALISLTIFLLLFISLAGSANSPTNAYDIEEIPYQKSARRIALDRGPSLIAAIDASTTGTA